MLWPKTEATQYHAQLGPTVKDGAIKGLVVCNDWDLSLTLKTLQTGRRTDRQKYNGGASLFKR